MIDAAAAARVAQLAYVGVFGGPGADFKLADDHIETEKLILDSGLPYTFLRNNWYTDARMFTGDLAGIVQRGAIVNSVSADARLATAPRIDYAAAATLVAAGVAASFAEILVDVDLAITRGALAATPGDLSHLIGRPTTPLADTIAAALTAQPGEATA